VSPNLNGLSKDWDFPELGFRDEFIISPANGVANEGNVEPRVVVGNEHRSPFRLVKVHEFVFASHYWAPSNCEQQELAPNLTHKYHQPLLIGKGVVRER
jgi:hypothetical protein